MSEQPKKCPDCNGAGKWNIICLNNFIDCPTCKGTGLKEVKNEN